VEKFSTKNICPILEKNIYVFFIFFVFFYILENILYMKKNIKIVSKIVFFLYIIKDTIKNEKKYRNQIKFHDKKSDFSIIYTDERGKKKI